MALRETISGPACALGVGCRLARCMPWTDCLPTHCLGPATIPTFGATGVPTITLYVAADELHLGGERILSAGAGLFPKFDPSLVLTAPKAQSPTHWQMPLGFLSEGREKRRSAITAIWTAGGALERTIAPCKAFREGRSSCWIWSTTPEVLEWLAGLLGSQSRVGFTGARASCPRTRSVGLW